MKTKIKLMALVAGLLTMLPTASVWAGGGSTTTYYAALKASVSNSGGGKVYAATSDKAGTYATTSTSGSQSSTTKDASKTFYAFAQADEGFEFAGWATSDGGSAVSTDNPYSVSVKCSSSSSGSPTTTTIWANFTKKLLAAFGITFETSDAGVYTVDGVAPANKTGLTEATSVKLASADPNFLSWKINGAEVGDNPYTATCLADTTISAVFLTPDQVAEATTYDELTAALANDGKKKITIPAGADITIAKGATVTVPAGKQLVVNGSLAVVGTLTNSGAISGNGTIYKVSWLVTQSDVIEPSNTYRSYTSFTMYSSSYSPKYCKTTTTANTPSVTGVTGFAEKWGVLLNGTKVYEISKQNPKALSVSFDTTKAVNYISSINGNIDAISGYPVVYLVLLADLTDTYKHDGYKGVGQSGTIDCAGKKYTASGQIDNHFHPILLNGSAVIGSGSYTQNANAAFINCTSINVNKCKGICYMYFFDCGTSSSLASVTISNYDSGATWNTYFYSGYYNYTFAKTVYVYGGTFSKDPTSYLQNNATENGLEVDMSVSGRYTVKEKKPPEYKLHSASNESARYETFQQAVAAVAANGSETFVLEGGVEISGTVTIPEGKRITIDLGGFNISGGTIENSGALRLEDNSNQEVKGLFSTPVVNKKGTIDITYGRYGGKFTLEGGTLTTHGGTFTSSFSYEEKGGVANLRGGTYNCTITVPEGHELVGSVLSETMRGVIICDNPLSSSADVSYTVRGLDPVDHGLGISDFDLYSNLKHSQSGWTTRSDFVRREALWDRLAELKCTVEPVESKAFEATMAFDRSVKAGSVSGVASLAGQTRSMALEDDIAAGEDYHVFIPMVTGAGYYAVSYKNMFNGEENDRWAKLQCGLKNNSSDNNGTVLTFKYQLRTQERAPGYTTQNPVYNYSFTTYAIGRYMLGGKKAAIDRDNGRVAFDSLSEAVAAAQNGETILLGADCAENVTLEKVGTFTIDPYGFKFTGSVSIGEGLEEGVPATTSDSLVVAQDVPSAPATTYVLKLSNVTVSIPTVANTTLAVTASEGEVTDLGNGQYQVAPGATVTATYTPNEGFFGNAIVKTIASAAEGAAVTVTDEEAASVKAIVAKIGETPYVSLAEAVEAAAEAGETIDVVKESTLTVAEGVELTVMAGQLVAAVPADNVLELKDGTDATLAWPEGDGAVDHIVVTGGRYSADPSAFLADGLEAKEKDGKWIVGVKIVAGDTEAETVVMTEKQESRVEKLEADEQAEVFKDVDAEKVVEVVEKIEQSTKVEGVKLTVTAESEQKPAGVASVVEAAIKQDAVFAAAVEVAAEVSVKVEVEVRPTEYVAPSEQAQGNTGKVAFKLTPKATVTVVKEAETLTQVVEVSNEMIDQKQKIKVSMYAGFKPVQVLHRDDNGQLIEEFTGDTIGYDEASGIVTVMISHFSSLELNEASVDPLAPSGATKVVDGFYQNATTYQDATEFYLTSKDGFHAFRDLINQDNGVIEDYIAKGCWNSTADQFYTTNPFNGKKVKLLCDVDEEDVAVKPIGMTSHSRTDGKDKRFFYGAFDGCNHKIINLRVVDDPATAKHRVGLFGNVTRNGNDTGIYNLTIENACITGYNYIGGFVGGAGGAVVVSNCHLIGSVTLSGTQYVGGMIGHVGDEVDAQVMDCSVEVVAGSTLTGNQSGGIVGYMGGGDVLGCTVKGLAINAKSSRVIGGISGQLPKAGCVIKDCTVDSVTVTARTKDAAGSVAGSFGAAGQRLLNNTVVNTHVYDPISDDDPSKLVEKFAQCQFIKDGDMTSIVGWGIEWDANEKIIAGTFERIDDSVIALGYEKAAQGTTPETWKVQEKIVAKIGDVTYPSLQAAIDEVGEGQTIVLLADTDEQLSGGAKKFVIDCGSGRDDVENIKQFDVENFAAQEGWMLQEFDVGDYHTYYEYIKPVCKVEVSGIFDDWVEYYETLADALSYERHNAYETIQLVADCDENVVIDITTYGLEDDKNPDLCNFTVEENGYNFTGSIVGVNGAKVTKNGTTWTIEPGYVAEIEGEWTTVKYLSLASAVAAAEDGDTVKLLSDAEETERLVVGKDVAIIIDLGGKTLTSSADVAVWLGEGSDLTIANGSLIAQNKGIYPNGENATATIAKDAYVEAGQWVMHSNGKAHTTFNVYGTAYCEWYPTIQLHSEDSTVNLDGANVRSFDYYAVYVNGSFCGDTVNIKDSTILSDQYLGVYVSNQYGRPFQTLNISGNTTITGLTAVEVKHANVTIGEGVNLIATHAPSFDEWDQGECTFGWSFATTRNGETDKPTGTITVTGGEFTGPFGIPSEIEETDEVSVAVTGGTFDYDPSEYVADGYEAVPQGTTPETWKVQEKVAEVAAVISADGTTTNGYATLQAAFDAAGNGETVVLLVDVTSAMNEAFTVAKGKSITFDLNGKVLSGGNNKATSFAYLTNNGMLTLKDSSAEGTGKITSKTYPDTGNFAGFHTVLNKGVFVMESGTIEEASEKVGGGNNLKWAFRNEASQGQTVVATIKGGTIVANYNAVSDYVYDDSSDCTLNIEGGVIKSTGRFSAVTLQDAGSSKPKFRVNISGGEFIVENKINTNADGNAIFYCDAQGNANADFTGCFKITGGKFNTFNTPMIAEFTADAGTPVADTKFMTAGLSKCVIPQESIADGYVCVGNPDEATKEAYPWKVQEPTVTTEDDAPIVIDIDPTAHEGAGETVPVVVTQDLAKEILGEEVAKLTPEQAATVVEKLEKKGDDGMTGWQKYTAGFKQTDQHPLAPKGKSAEDGKLVLVTSLVQPKQLSVDTGVKVKYILKKATTVNPATGVPDDAAFEPVQELDSPEFPVDVTELPPETYWKIDVEYTATKTEL